MAGSNKVMKPGEVLFKAGDQSNGMYLIRKGELKVYLEDEGKELHLGSIADGGMLGEMAFFENKPRSASVKATKQTEVTLISNDDFAKLLKQIPKWFVTIMQALSGRLRQTNERLQKLEGMQAQGASPLNNLLRIMNILVLLWHKDGAKEKRAWLLNSETAHNTLIHMFNEDKDLVKTFFDTCNDLKLITKVKDSYGNVCYSIANKGVLERLIQFANAFGKNNPGSAALSEASLQVLITFEELVNSTAYTTATISLADLELEGKRKGYDTSKWQEAMLTLKKAGDAVALVKVSGGGIGLRATKKELPHYMHHHKMLLGLHKAGLS